jgi:hypothetical protein
MELIALREFKYGYLQLHAILNINVYIEFLNII